MSFTDASARGPTSVAIQEEASPTEDVAAVAAVLARVSAAWQERRFDLLADCFDENVVMLLPGGTGRVQGRRALVDSYRAFMEAATISEYHEDPPTIDVWGDTAVGSYRWSMSWVAGADPESGAGCDVLVFQRTHDASSPDGGEWRAVWRTMVLEPPST